jgi:hypothetical protein
VKQTVNATIPMSAMSGEQASIQLTAHYPVRRGLAKAGRGNGSGPQASAGVQMREESTVSSSRVTGQGRCNRERADLITQKPTDVGVLSASSPTRGRDWAAEIRVTRVINHSEARSVGASCMRQRLLLFAKSG